MTTNMIITICCVVAIGFHLGSAHLNPDRDFNNHNSGIYFKLDNKVTVGTYANSTGNQSSYIVKEYKFTRKLSVNYGVITGYNNSIIPVVAPTIKLNSYFNVSVLPKTQITGANVIHLTYEIKL